MKFFSFTEISQSKSSREFGH